MPEKTHRIAWTSIILEAFFVVLGVALAFAVNEWREARARQQEAEAAVAKIADELVVNRDAVLASAVYHSSVVDTLRFFVVQARRLGADAEKPNMRHFPQGFSRPGVLLYTAWEAANATDAVGAMPFERVAEFSRIYHSQERYDRQSERVGALIFEMLFYEGYRGMLDNFENYVGILGAFVYRECGLLQEYNRALTTLDVPPTDLPDVCADFTPREGSSG